MRSIISRIIDARTVDQSTRDDIGRTLAAAMPRRSAFRLLGGGALGTLLFGRGLAGVAAKCRKKGKKCHRNGQCCSGKCKHKKCRGNGGSGPGPEPSRDHVVTVSALFDITDDELFGEDDRCVARLDDDQALTPSSPVQSFHLEKGCGGEVRIELDLTARLLSNGDVRMSGRAYLYEGVTEETTDLDGEETIAEFEVSEGTPFVYRVRIVNEDEGDDFATIEITVTNAAA